MWWWPVEGSETNAVLNKKLGNRNYLAGQRPLDAVVEDLQTVRGDGERRRVVRRAAVGSVVGSDREER